MGVMAMATTAALAGEKVSVCLVKEGQPCATIVIPEKSGDLNLAIEELNHHFKAAMGCGLPVVNEKEVDKISGNLLLLGDSALTRALGIKTADLPPEGFVIRTFPGKVAIVGSSEYLIDGWFRQKTRGNLWAVYRFLEDAMGVRWYAPGPLGTVIPERKNLYVSLQVRDAPAYPIRTFATSMYRVSNKRLPSYYGMAKDRKKRKRQFDLFKRRSRWSGLNLEENAYGNVLGMHSAMHWAELYHESHPEYFALLSNGSRALYPPNRQSSHWRMKLWRGWLDYSSDAVLQQYIQNHLDWYAGRNPQMTDIWKKHQHSRVPGEFSIPAGPNDGLVLDQGEKARALYAMSHVGNPFGSLSDYIHRFYARFAQAMYKEFPRKKVTVLAYSGFALPPKRKIDFPPNYLVHLCVMQAPAIWKEEPIYKEWLDIARKWHELTHNKIHFWQYSCWPTINAPFICPYEWQKWYRDTRSFGLGAMVNGSPLNLNIGMHHLNKYFFARILWNPDYDIDAGLREYAQKMYGPAHAQMYGFFRTLIDRWRNTKWNLNHFQRAPSSSMLYGKEGTYPPAIITRLRKALADAGQVKGLTGLQRRRIDWISRDFAGWFDEAERLAGNRSEYVYAFKLTQAPVIDARCDDTAWQGIPLLRINRFLDDGSESPVRSLVRIGWTDEALYLAVENSEPHMEHLRDREPDRGFVFNDDCVELFLDPKATRSDHFQLCFNAAASRKCFRVETGLTDPDWMPDGMELKTAKGPDGWNLELKLPFAALGVKRFTAGRWVWNLFRHRIPGGDRYLALVPTMMRKTNVKDVFPELLLVPRPGLLYEFEDKRTGQAVACAWNRERAGSDRIAGGLLLDDNDGKRKFRFSKRIFAGRKGVYAYVNGTVWHHQGADWPTGSEATFETRIRWQAGAAIRVKLIGMVMTADRKKRYFASTLYNGDAKGEWQTLGRRLRELQAEDNKGRSLGKAIRDNDKLLQLGLHVTAPADKETSGEIEYVLIGDMTALQIRDRE